MNIFFTQTTDDYGSSALGLTTAGFIGIVTIIIIAAVIGLIFAKNRKKTVRFSTTQLIVSAMAIALASVTSMIHLFNMPMGGSITLCSMFFISLIGYWYGAPAGIMTGVAYGLLQFIINPIFYTIPQMLTDYPLAFGALGVSGFFAGKKNGMTIGYIFSVIGRYIFAFISGWIFFGEYAADYNMGAVAYSLVYNGLYLIPEAIITIIIINLQPVKNALKTIGNSIYK